MYYLLHQVRPGGAHTIDMILHNVVPMFEDFVWVRARSHLATTMYFFCRHARTFILMTMQPISDDVVTTSKICSNQVRMDPQ